MSGWLQRAHATALNPPPDVAKAAEWLLDNEYQVQRAVHQIAQDLPAGFYRRLPSLENPEEEGAPRIFAVGYGLIEALNFQLSSASAAKFIRAYQEGAPLTIAELWALPTMLRLACLEILVCGWARLIPDVNPPFAPTCHAAGCNAFDGTECVSRAIAGLITISSIPWKDFFDHTSLVEAILGEDPADAYSRSEFETRDRYRKAVEELALRTGQPETEVARRAVALAQERQGTAPSDHVGYWLVGDGRNALEPPVGVLSPEIWRRLLFRHVGKLYGIALIAFTAVALSVPAMYLADVGASPGTLLLGVVVAMLPASVIGIAAVHAIIALIVSPRTLPKLDFQKGIAADCATAVAIPVIVGAADEVPALMERLELHRLANPDPSLRFVLLSDHADAPSERMAGDDETEQALVAGIRRLNNRYGREGDRPFYLLHRSRRFNPSEGCWMDWERKRGKFEELNRLILTNDTSGFSLREGDHAKLGGVRFVVTVDADTTLPHGSVARLVGALAHPLNSARFDEKTGRVASGYTVLQPRIGISPDSGGQSLFARLYAGDTAIDIYPRAVSDVYQDLFGSGVYAGKGIYEVASFHRGLEGLVPENALLSHDLFEGVHGRAALASDIVVYEEFPNSYVEYARRWHRRIRGDWQLLPWLARKVPGVGGRQPSSRLNAIDRWKVLDSLRRSLVAPSLLLLAAAGWLGLPGSPWIWTALTIAAPSACLFVDLIASLARRRRRGAAFGALHPIGDHWGRWLLAIVFLAHDAVVALDAVVRTLWRLFVSHRHLLEWTSAARTAKAVNGQSIRAAAWRAMWPTSVLAAAMALAVALVNLPALAPAALLLLLWLAAPEIAAWLSHPPVGRKEELGADDSAFLRRLARRTWLYFETFAGPADNWLPPDNVQEETEVAHRTSPTNIGMMFLSSLAAWDLGYAGSKEFAARIRNSFDTLDRLERYHGHFLNWYDTRLLKPLEPRYVSTVDSGNLAVCLIALKKGCQEAADSTALRPEQWDGLAETLSVLSEAVRRLPGNETGEFRACMAANRQRVTRARNDVSTALSMLTEINGQTFPRLRTAVAKAVEQSGQAPAGILQDIQTWLERARHHLDGMQRDIEALLPWTSLLATPPPGCEGLAGELAALAAASVPMTEINDCCDRARAKLANAKSKRDGVEQWFSEVEAALERGVRNQASLREELLSLAQRSEALAFAMDFKPLFDPERRLFHVGYNVSGDHLDSSCYDLLASEARLASFFAIARGDVPFEHWSFLGRPMARTTAGPTLISWGGSMFEYLMPALFLQSGPHTLLGRSERAAVDVQRRYAKRHGVPWGMSESAYARRNADRHYRYRGFGVPELGLRRGLSDDLVIAPYASALALAVRTAAAVRNLRELERLGLAGRYGLIEAGDFTLERMPEETRFLPVHAYMAHHQGMTLAALDNALCDMALVRRFRADALVRAAELLVHERTPWEQPLEVRATEEREALRQHRPPIPALQAWVPQSAEAFPQLNALGNGRLASWISEAGGGGLSWHGQSLTRWLPDPTQDHFGLWIYVRDEDDGSVWSVGRQPTAVTPDEARVVFHPHMAEFHRHDRGIGIRMEVGVVPVDHLEFRRITVVNDSERPRRLRFVSYGEVVLADRLEDERHPAFSKLFVGSEYLPEMSGLLFTRRPRRPDEKPPVLLHRVLIEEPGVELAGFETDRRAFLGRNGNVRHPTAMRESLSGATGWTLDAVMALDVRINLEPHARRQFAFLTMVAEWRESLLALAQRYATLASLEWGLGEAVAEVAREIQRLGLEPARLPELQMLASLLAYRHPALRAAADAIASNRLGQPRLWALGISGDYPILLVHVRDPEETDFLRKLIAGQMFWRRRGIEIDLVVLHGGTSGYGEPFRERFAALLDEAGVQQPAGRTGRTHLILADQIREEEGRLLEASAQVVLDASKGPLASQLAPAQQPRTYSPRFEPTGIRIGGEEPATLARATGLLFDNGFGGFSADGGEYVVHLEAGQATPAPWCNVLANDRFGTIVTEAGGGFTWGLNSGENRLTPWTNDPVADPPGEVLYLRDEETAEIWTPTPKPAGEGASCEIRHGAGYTVWRNAGHGIEHELRAFVPVDDPVKIIKLRLRNLEARTRHVTATYYAEWLLGALCSTARPFVVCEYDPACHALLARSSWNPDFAERTAFLTSSLPPSSLTSDRQDFVGRDGDLTAPVGLMRWDLGGRVGPGGDACAAFQVRLEIGAAAETEVVFVLGQGDDRAHAQELARRWQDPSIVDSAIEELARHWNKRLGAVQVRTPDPAFDLMVNRWLPYQILASRILARAGFHQAGGAFGFRDQLQDVLALLHAEPAKARAHILDAAARQFQEGDVLHWWHPPDNRGVRTRCSDDLLWLPYVTGCYVEATGDDSILREEVPLLSAEPLKPEEDDRYARFDAALGPRPLFEHCELALEHGVTRGIHDLPLIGSGDWNDGMNRIGRAGRGESVWLAWFAIAAMRRFANLCRRTGRNDLAERWLSRAPQLDEAVEKTAWDGRWYLRAFDDEGRSIGSASADECRIDSIAQSWAVLAGDSNSSRARTAVESAARELVRESEHVVRLLWPPFDATSRDPGYIKAYPPGIRENGGQYSHAAAWLGHAFAELGDGERARQIFDLLNPIRRASTRTEAERYRVEPYVMAADIASVAPHTGQGGWTWYTGSAAWTWRLGVEAILGLRLREGKLLIDPCLPKDWGFFEAEIRGAAGNLLIRVDDPEKIGKGQIEMTVDGIRAVGATVAFPTDGSTRRFNVRLRRASRKAAGP